MRKQRRKPYNEDDYPWIDFSVRIPEWSGQIRGSAEWDHREQMRDLSGRKCLSWGKL
jgi:hypothetical protein